MVRGKVVMKRIENCTNRQVAFSKRRKGIMKKAYELSVLCESQVSVIIFSQNGKLYEFSSSEYLPGTPSKHRTTSDSPLNYVRCLRGSYPFLRNNRFMQRSLERYSKYGKIGLTNSYSSQSYMQKLKHEVEETAKKVELLEISKQKLLGRGIDSCSLDELKEIEKQLELSLLRIRERKSQLFMEQREQLIAKEKLLLEENARLSAKSCGKPWQPEGADAEGAIVRYCSKSSKNYEIETELFIGLPCHSHSHREELC